MEEKVIGLLIVLILGFFPLIRGIWMLRGGSKGWYLSRNVYAGFSYAQIPMGIGALSFVVSAVSQLEIFTDIGIGFFIIGFLFNFLQPTFLKPAWLRWLRGEHRDIWPLLVEEAHAIGLENWEKRVETQAGLEEWVAEVREKYKV